MGDRCGGSSGEGPAQQTLTIPQLELELDLRSSPVVNMNPGRGRGPNPMQLAADAGRSRLETSLGGDERQPKGDVNYRPAQSQDEACGSCRHFDGDGGCDVVAGRIDPAGVSDLFEPIDEEPPMPEMPGGTPVAPLGAQPPGPIA